MSVYIRNGDIINQYNEEIIVYLEIARSLKCMTIPGKTGQNKYKMGGTVIGLAVKGFNDQFKHYYIAPNKDKVPAKTLTVSGTHNQNPVAQSESLVFDLLEVPAEDFHDFPNG